MKYYTISHSPSTDIDEDMQGYSVDKKLLEGQLVLLQW